MTLLRIALPPLAHLTAHSEFEYVGLDSSGRVSQPRVGTFMQLGEAARSQAVECFLHPVDSVLTRIEIPPLSSARIGAAVRLAAQALMLGDSDQMHIAHSGRDGAGWVHVSWLPKAHLDCLGQLLWQHRLALRGLYPAPYRLALPPDGQTSACVQDGQLLLRLNAEQATVEPVFEECLAERLAQGEVFHWIGDNAPAGVFTQQPATWLWTGVAPKWGLQGGTRQPRVAAQGWGRAVGCCLLALAVWAIGLNLYAAREVSEGQRMKQQMSQRVRQAFPELPVILNPLQQARQQLAARKQGAVSDPGQLFNRLVLQAGSGMPFMSASVERLVFVDGALQLTLLADARRFGADRSWQDSLARVGISAKADENGWTLRPVEGPAGYPDAPTDDSSGAGDE
ncbi:type II secretion system protein GspL [Pseudomonas sp. COR18]|uniref:type II secretion system protein GspL n=1 Tax=Pseudomonas sp. COR18 TaxID=3399680 RepID=UPI003AFF639A